MLPRMGVVGQLFWYRWESSGRGGGGSSVLVKAVSFAFKGCYCCCLVVFFPEMM